MQRIIIKPILVSLAVLALIFGVIMAFITSPFFKYPQNGAYPASRIESLIWPTIGCPALALPGGTIEVEMDLRADGSETQPAEVPAWRAVITPAREELKSLSYELPLLDSLVATSNHWPDREDVWRARFQLPEQVGKELYDLRVDAELPGRRISGSQPHALSVAPDNDNNFDFIVLSDIHVHERDNSSLLVYQTDKGISDEGEPLFLEEAIKQVNLIRPDFVLMLGDYTRGQRRPGELLIEYEKFYRALLDLNVPAFLVPGNHDGYINEIDGLRFFEENIGPAYFSFDVGGCHFTCLNTYDWPAEDRVVMNKLFYMGPRKWQGQVRGASDEKNPSTYSGELAWAESDLAAHDRASLKVMAMHHDPYSVNGGGYAYRNVVRGVFDTRGGGGKGREALLTMGSRHDIGVVFGGHLHSDELGRVAWADGGGETIYTCQNPVYFGAGGESDEYPAYRLVEIRNGRVDSMSYLDGVSSFPFYDGSVPMGITDIDLLQLPALQFQSETGEDGGFHANIDISNYLASPMLLEGLVIEAPQAAVSGFEVEGGEIYQVLPIAGKPGRVLLYIRVSLAAGDPGPSAEIPGEPAVTRIVVRTLN